jgi:hypothetical protein
MMLLGLAAAFGYFVIALLALIEDYRQLHKDDDQ